MWSLPDIVALNNRASNEKDALFNTLETGIDSNGETLTCAHCDEPATVRIPWYDIFGEDPKGIVALCEQHDCYYGCPDEGYFACDDCGNVFAENYTWEGYKHVDFDACEELCLNCYRERVLTNSEHPAWVNLADIDSIDFERVRKAPHLIAVGQDTPDTLRFLGNVEMDGCSGGKLWGFSHADSTPDAAVEDVRELLRKAREDGAERAILILDAAYQFSVSVGVYTPNGATR